MAKTQTKRAKKTSNGEHKMRKNPMTPLMRILNNKGAYRALEPVKANRYAVTVGKEPFDKDQIRINKVLYPHLFMDAAR